MPHRATRHRLQTTLFGLTALLLLPATQAQEPPPAPVRLATVELGKLTEQLTLPATVRSRRRVSLSTEVDGLVAELLVDEGDRVSKGQVVLVLRQTPARLTLQGEQAALKRALAGAKLARLKETRLAELIKSRLTAQDSYDIARAELEQAEAGVAASRAKVAQLQDRLDRHTVKAPFDAVVEAKLTELGHWLKQGDSALTLVEDGVVRVRFALPQQFQQRLGPGAPVEIRFDAFPKNRVNAEVTRVALVANEAARTLPGWIELSNPELPILPGMSADVTLQIPNTTPGLLVPRDALVMAPDGSEAVWVVRKEGGKSVAQAIPVLRLRQVGNRIEIDAKGISSGDQIVVSGNERLRPGQAVAVEQ